MKASDMKRDLRVTCGTLGEVTLVAPVGPHEFDADGYALAKSIRGADRVIEPAVVDVFGAIIKEAITEEVWSEGGFPPKVWMALNAAWELRAVDADLCEPLP